MDSVIIFLSGKISGGLRSRWTYKDNTKHFMPLPQESFAEGIMFLGCTLCCSSGQILLPR